MDKKRVKLMREYLGGTQRYAVQTKWTGQTVRPTDSRSEAYSETPIHWTPWFNTESPITPEYDTESRFRASRGRFEVGGQERTRIILFLPQE